VIYKTTNRFHSPVNMSVYVVKDMEINLEYNASYNIQRSTKISPNFASVQVDANLGAVDEKFLNQLVAATASAAKKRKLSTLPAVRYVNSLKINCKSVSNFLPCPKEFPRLTLTNVVMFSVSRSPCGLSVVVG